MSNSSSGGIGIGTATIVFAILAYFVYGKSISAGLGMLLLSIVSGFAVTLSIIPFVGALLTYYVNSNYVYPIVMNFTGLYPTWVTTAQFWLHVGIGVAITIGVTLLVIAGIIKAVLR